MSDLKPCPFCGGEAVLKEQHHIPNGYDYTPTCLNPSCAGRITKKWINKEDAIKAWNRRAEPEQKKGKWIPIPAFENMRCSNCQLVFRDSMYPKNFCPNCGAEMMRGE